MEKTLKETLRDYGLRPKRSLGQVFLIERSIQQKILEVAELDPEDTIVEIGPGTGALTLEMLGRVKRLIALELDKDLARYLRTQVDPGSNLHLICMDALRFDYLRAADRLHTSLKVVGNLPYVISSPMIFTFIEHLPSLSLLVLMLQKEVVDRLTASPGTKAYGALTVLTSFHFRIQRMRNVSRHCFYPVPAVDSAVIRCHPRVFENLEPEEEERFRTIVKAAFSKRRKTLLNSLRLSPQLDLSTSRLKDAMGRSNIDPKRRPETLSLEEFLSLSLCTLEAT